MLISFIVALDQNRGIGHRGQVPWRLSSDLRRFKALTWGHHIIMGRKTHQSIGRALPGRVNLVISRNENYHPEDCILVASLDQALEYARQAGETEAFIIGGAEIFTQAIPLAQRLYLTKVDAILPADVFFPSIKKSEWKIIFREEVSASPNDQFSYKYVILERDDG